MGLAATWSLDQIRNTLTSKDADIVARMMAIFYARYHNSEEAVQALAEGLWHPSVLLRHEIAYVLGQMSQPSALPILIQLSDELNEHPMVRHEAGEALNALGITSDEVFACVERHIKDPTPPVRETFELAYIGLKLKKEGKRGNPKLTDPSKGFYLFTASGRINEEPAESSVPTEFATTKDPAEGDAAMQRADKVEELGRLLRNEGACLWDRYVAMFTLRNINTREAAWELALSLDDKSSPLLRHEICFVLGQMQLAVCLEKLIERVEDLDEASMARHEAALALGSVGADIWSKEGKAARIRALEILEKYAADPDPIVAESCIVALHNIEWETGISAQEQRC